MANPKRVPLTIYTPFRGASNPSCRACELGPTVASVCVPMHRTASSLDPTPSTPILLIIGQNPGQLEDAENAPFIGPSGHVLHTGYIDGSHLDRLSTIFVTNYVRCLTPQNSIPKYKPHGIPCFPYLQADIEYLSKEYPTNPLVLLLLGAPAAATSLRLLFPTHFPKLPSLELAIRHNGRAYPCSFLSDRPLTIFTSYHPAAFLRDPNKLVEIHHHLGQLNRWLQGVTPRVTIPDVVPPFPPPE